MLQAVRDWGEALVPCCHGPDYAGSCTPPQVRPIRLDSTAGQHLDCESRRTSTRLFALGRCFCFNRQSPAGPQKPDTIYRMFRVQLKLGGHGWIARPSGTSGWHWRTTRLERQWNEAAPPGLEANAQTWRWINWGTGFVQLASFGTEDFDYDLLHEPGREYDSPNRTRKEKGKFIQNMETPLTQQ